MYHIVRRTKCFEVLNFSISCHSTHANVLSIDLLSGYPSQAWNIHMISRIYKCVLFRREIVNEYCRRGSLLRSSIYINGNNLEQDIRSR